MKKCGLVDSGACCRTHYQGLSTKDHHTKLDQRRELATTSTRNHERRRIWCGLQMMPSHQHLVGLYSAKYYQLKREAEDRKRYIYSDGVVDGLHTTSDVINTAFA